MSDARDDEVKQALESIYTVAVRGIAHLDASEPASAALSFHRIRERVIAAQMRLGLPTQE